MYHPATAFEEANGELMSAWILGGSLALLTAAVGLPYTWYVRRGAHRCSAGLRAIAALRWKELATLVGQAMQQRGLRDFQGHPGALHPGSRLLMTDGNRRWLLSCKHGRAYRLARRHIHQLMEEMDLAGAHHGILLTEGKARPDAQASAARHGIEIIDGRRLWSLVRPYLSPLVLVQIEAEAERRTRLETLGVAIFALVLAIGLGAWGDRLEAALSRGKAPVAAEASTAPAGTEADPLASQMSEPPPLPEDADIEAFPDEATLQLYRNEVVRSVSQKPGVGRAYWLTHHTLVVNRTGSIDAIWPLICAELERYPALRAVRVQLNARPGRDEQVRWRQCRVQ